MTAECEGWLCPGKKWIARVNFRVIKVNIREVLIKKWTTW
jgi:hypothetical protein